MPQLQVDWRMEAMIVTVSRYAHDTPLPVSRMIADLGNKMQICTQVARVLVTENHGVK